MTVEGRIAIELFPGEARLDLRSTRAVHAAKVFAGLTPDAVLQRMPLLFSLCGCAQATAAVEALCCSQALTVPAPVAAARSALVHMETAREHLWRILIDWPALLDEGPQLRTARPLQKLLPRFRSALFADGDAFSMIGQPQIDRFGVDAAISLLESAIKSHVLGRRPAEWLKIEDPGAFRDWSATTGTVAGRLVHSVIASGWQGSGAVGTDFLPDVAPAELNRKLAGSEGDRFIERPTWNATPCETTPLARRRTHPLIAALRVHFGDGLLTRLASVLVELASLPGEIRTLLGGEGTCRAAAENLPANTGVAAVEAARGRLLHRVVLRDGHVATYQIVAPTEWNFHPDGALANGLRNLGTGARPILERQAAMLITAVDPCVGYDLKVH